MGLVDSMTQRVAGLMAIEESLRSGDTSAFSLSPERPRKGSSTPGEEGGNETPRSGGAGSAPASPTPKERISSPLRLPHHLRLIVEEPSVGSVGRSELTSTRSMGGRDSPHSTHVLSELGRQAEQLRAELARRDDTIASQSQEISQLKDSSFMSRTPKAMSDANRSCGSESFAVAGLGPSASSGSLAGGSYLAAPRWTQGGSCTLGVFGGTRGLAAVPGTPVTLAAAGSRNCRWATVPPAPLLSQRDQDPRASLGPVVTLPRTGSAVQVSSPPCFRWQTTPLAEQAQEPVALAGVPSVPRRTSANANVGVRTAVAGSRVAVSSSGFGSVGSPAPANPILGDCFPVARAATGGAASSAGGSVRGGGSLRVAGPAGASERGRSGSPFPIASPIVGGSPTPGSTPARDKSSRAPWCTASAPTLPGLHHHKRSASVPESRSPRDRGARSPARSPSPAPVRSPSPARSPRTCDLLVKISDPAPHKDPREGGSVVWRSHWRLVKGARA
jgi:hypothetical protein